MKKEYLSQYFEGVAAKRLSAVEVDLTKSHQHEFNGVTRLKEIFGKSRKTFPTHFIYLNDYDYEPLVSEGFLTWYDARENHATRSEYRMYFSRTEVTNKASEGDELFIGLRQDKSALVIIAGFGSTISNQLRWLFGLGKFEKNAFSIRDGLETEQDKLEFTSRIILEQLGIEVDEQEDKYLDEMLQRFDNKFPTTKVFSEYARNTIKDIQWGDDPDVVIMKWIEREEILFRTLEKHLLKDRLSTGFKDDVDSFIKYSLSVQNRRKSRAGQSLENHLEQLFIRHKIRYGRNMVTENNSKPDFIFPGIIEYHDPNFDTVLLTMLGVKSTCKDRWRQVLSEAEKISQKHLFTLEAAISENQTQEMQHHNLQLVLPKTLHKTYTETQQDWLMNVSDFIERVKYRQRRKVSCNGK